MSVVFGPGVGRIDQFQTFVVAFVVSGFGTNPSQPQQSGCGASWSVPIPCAGAILTGTAAIDVVNPLPAGPFSLRCPDGQVVPAVPVGPQWTAGCTFTPVGMDTLTILPPVDA